MKLWGGRFSKQTDKLMEAFSASIPFDSRLAEEDIIGSIAHCEMLAQCGIITIKEGNEIALALSEILKEFSSGELSFPIESEDIHMRIEQRLIEKIGIVGKKLHTARSRNDQVALDMHIFVKKEIKNIFELICVFQQKIIDISQENISVIMPGYTHMQRAQPVLFAHHMMAYFWMFERDKGRLNDALSRADMMPLGAAALAGTTFAIDREIVASKLGFASLYENSMDAVSDRDFVAELLFTISLIMTHLSRISEDIILWNTTEFGFIEIGDDFTTGSSIMPQKKNPDVAELVRGKSGRTTGNLIGMLTILKGLPLTYNRDMQEDKELLFDSIDTVKDCLEIYSAMFATIKPNKAKMFSAVDGDMCSSTDMADFLVRKGLPFREAHGIVGRLVSMCLTNGKRLTDLNMTELKTYSTLFDEEILQVLSPESCINSRNIRGGTAISAVDKQIQTAKSALQKSITED